MKKTILMFLIILVVFVSLAGCAKKRSYCYSLSDIQQRVECLLNEVNIACKECAIKQAEEQVEKNTQEEEK